MEHREALRRVVERASESKGPGFAGVVLTVTFSHQPPERSGIIRVEHAWTADKTGDYTYCPEMRFKEYSHDDIRHDVS